MNNDAHDNNNDKNTRNDNDDDDESGYGKKQLVPIIKFWKS